MKVETMIKNNNMQLGWEAEEESAHFSIKLHHFQRSWKCWKRKGTYPVPKLEWMKTLPRRLGE
jgi:hypothetical protein